MVQVGSVVWSGVDSMRVERKGKLGVEDEGEDKAMEEA